MSSISAGVMGVKTALTCSNWLYSSLKRLISLKSFMFTASEAALGLTRGMILARRSGISGLSISQATRSFHFLFP